MMWIVRYELDQQGFQERIERSSVGSLARCASGRAWVGSLGSPPTCLMGGFPPIFRWPSSDRASAHEQATMEDRLY